MAPPRKRIVLISNRVMHYRVSVYNYFHRRFAEHDWEWLVVTNTIQKENRIGTAFEVEEIPFSFRRYRKKIRAIKPDAVIIFLHLKDRILWPLIHWLRLARIPFAVWTKTRNFDDPSNRVKNWLFDYVHRLSNGIILYSESLRRNLPSSCRAKAFAANNTNNNEALPSISEPPGEIKRRLGIPFDKVVLFVGRMDVDGGRKRVDCLIEIFRNEVPEGAGLIIVGSGMRRELQERINPSTTCYLGEIQDPKNYEISRIFTVADMCAIPGHVGLGLNQAQFYGLPVVTMEGNQPPEISYLIDGRNGYIVPEGDIDALRSRIFELLESDSLRRQMGTAARTDFYRHASIEQMFQGFLETVEHISRPPR